MLDQLPRAVGVGQAQAARSQAVGAVVDQVVPLAGQLVDAVDVGGPVAVFLVQRQVERPAVALTRAGVDDLGIRVVIPAGFQDEELAARVDLQVGEGIGHRVEVADLAGQVEDHVGARHERVHGMRIAHVGDVDLYQVLDAGDVEAVAAVVGNERIDQQDTRDPRSTRRCARLEPMKPSPPVMMIRRLR